MQKLPPSIINNKSLENFVNLVKNENIIILRGLAKFFNIPTLLCFWIEYKIFSILVKRLLFSMKNNKSKENIVNLLKSEDITIWGGLEKLLNILSSYLVLLNRIQNI